MDVAEEEERALFLLDVDGDGSRSSFLVCWPFVERPERRGSSRVTVKVEC